MALLLHHQTRTTHLPFLLKQEKGNPPHLPFLLKQETGNPLRLPFCLTSPIATHKDFK
jgi:hypothetical protein